MAQTDSRQQLGAQGEDLAAQTLRAAGLVIVTRNWRCRWGEVDIVARDWSGGRSTLVFCEVKTRRGKGYGTPAESITWQKQKTLRRLAAEFMRVEQYQADAIRIDVIGIVMRPDQPPMINHLRAVGS